MSEKLSIDVVARTLGIKGLTDLRSAFQLVGAAISGVKNFVGDLSKAYGTQEQADKKLAVAVGGSVKELKAFSSQMQEVTTVGDETVQQMMQLGSSMGISKDQLNEASQGAIGLSKAFGTDLNTSMKLVALANEEEYSMLGRYIPELRTATTEAEKHAIVQKAMADGFEIAKAEADTFTGRIDQLKNAQGDLNETGGRIVAVIGKEFVEAMTRGTKAITNFLSDSDKVATIGASFKVLGEVGKELGGAVWQTVKDTFGEIKDKLGELIPQGKESSVVFTALASAGKLIGMAFSVMVKGIGLVIKGFINAINIGKEYVKLSMNLWDAITGKKKWSEVAKSLKDVGGAYKDFYVELGTGAVDIVKETIDEFKKLPEDVSNSADKLKDTFAKNFKEYKENLEKDVETPTKEATKIIENETKNWNEAFKSANKDIKGAYTDTSSATSNFLGTTMNSVNSAFTDIAATMTDDTENAVNKVLKTLKAMAEGAGAILAGVQEMFNAHYEEQLTALDDWKENHLEGVDEWMAEEMERQGVREEAESERLQREYEEKQAAADAETDAEKKAQLQQEANELLTEQKRAAIKETAEAKKEKIEKEAAKKELKLKKEQFEANKAFQIGQIWINAASAVMGFWSAYASIPIAGPIMAAAFSAIALGIAGAQTGIIASQTFHAQEGGEITGGGITGDNAMLFANKGEAVLQSQDYKSLVGMARGESISSNGNTFYIENFYSSAKSLDEMVEELNDIERYERTR